MRRGTARRESEVRVTNGFLQRVRNRLTIQTTAARTSDQKPSLRSSTTCSGVSARPVK